MPFITRLMITCCSWTRSPRIMGRAGASSVRNDTRWLVSSRCTSAMTSLTTSLMSSGTFSMSVLFASARTRRITSLARLPSLMIHSTERRAAARSGVSRSSQRRQASRVGDDGGERLVYFMGDGGGQFAQRRHARDMCEFRLRLAQCLLGLICADRRRDIGAGATIAEKIAVCVENWLAAGTDVYWRSIPFTVYTKSRNG